jgi:hypothetical protein
MSDEASPYTDEDRERWRKRLLAKGGEVAAMLEKLLAKKDVDLADLGLRMTDDEKEPKEKRLRRYFDVIMKRMRAVDHPRFGYDPEEGRFLKVAELDEMPWAEVEPF